MLIGHVLDDQPPPSCELADAWRVAPRSPPRALSISR
jgi:hypothetical protein